jgi:hypothetical protein
MWAIAWCGGERVRGGGGVVESGCAVAVVVESGCAVAVVVLQAARDLVEVKACVEGVRLRGGCELPRLMWASKRRRVEYGRVRQRGGAIRKQFGCCEGGGDLWKFRRRKWESWQPQKDTLRRLFFRASSLTIVFPEPVGDSSNACEKLCQHSSRHPLSTST